MKKLALVAATAAFALAGCGETTDASQDATADSVEIPADEAMADAPDPVATEEDVEEGMDANVEEAEAAADAAQATVDDALSAAEAAQNTVNAAE
jgi:hypothetical protein